MKNILKLSFILLFLMGAVVSHAQEEVRIKKKSYGAINYGFKNQSPRFDGHLSGIGLGYSGLVTNFGNFSLPSDASFMSQKGNSIAFDLNPYNYSIGLSKKVGFVIGIGLEVNNFKFDQNVSLKQNEDGYIVADDYGARGTTLEKSKLTAAYLNIPILFEVQFGRYSEGFVNFGVIGAWRMQSHTKIIAHGDEVKGKYKNKKGLNMNNFRYGYMAQIGCNKVGLYAKYYPESIFKNNRGPEVQQVNIGLIFYFRDFY